MAEQLHEFAPLDSGRINTDDPLEVAYWARQLGCTEARLVDAVAAVGTHVAAVRDHLRGAPPRVGTATAPG